ncbi:MAG: MarR family transcriptional regulator [Promethearchaeota archaeon]
MFRKKKPSELELLEEDLNKKLSNVDTRINEATQEFASRIATIEKQIEGSALRQSELSQTLENRSVEIRTQSTKEFKTSLEEVRSSLETLSLELNNQMLDLSTRLENLDQNSSNWSFAVNEQIEEFREKYVTVLEELRQGKNIAVEREQILTQKYEELVNQLKEKEKLALEKESLAQQRIGTLQEEIQKKGEEVAKASSQLEQLESELKEKNKLIEELKQRKIEADELKITLKRLKEENEMKTYELDRTKTQIQTMAEDTKQSIGTSKAIKTFLNESESGRILNHLMSLEQVTVDDLATMTGITTYTVQQIVNHFRDMGIITFDEGSRRARLAD